jgi:hypothetical protein
MDPRFLAVRDLAFAGHAIIDRHVIWKSAHDLNQIW